MAYDSTKFERLSTARLAEAKSLVAAGLFSGAYYLAGYAIECALKAKIADKFKQGEIPDRKFVNDIYTHDLFRLIALAEIDNALDAAMATNELLGEQWELVKRWKEDARYEVWTEGQAFDMISAVEGVFTWLTGL